MQNNKTKLVKEIIDSIVSFLRVLTMRRSGIKEVQAPPIKTEDIKTESREPKAIPIVDPKPAQNGFLICPILGTDANGKPLISRTVRISSVLDRSGTAIDPNSKNRWGKSAKDQKVKAFNGELGDGDPSAEAPFGYTKKLPAPFFALGEINYVGAASSGDKYGPTYYLNYDGHAGYDFAYPKLTSIVAPASGQLCKASQGEDMTYGANWNTDHSFYIKHENGYITWYRHCEKLNDLIEDQIVNDFKKEYKVEKGEIIAFVGKVGTGSFHLHFEVLNDKKVIVDPYADQLWEF